MRQIRYILPLLVLVSLFSSCKKDLPQLLAFDSYVYSSTDEDGGTCKPILINSGSDIAIPAPSDVSSAAYLQELDDLKMELAQVSNSER